MRRHSRSIGAPAMTAVFRIGDGIRREAMQALRQLSQEPLPAVVTLVSLGLAIGCTVAIVGALDSLWLRALPYQHPERLVVVASKTSEGKTQAVSLADLREWAVQASPVSLTAYRPITVVRDGESRAEILRAVAASPDLWEMLGVVPVAGALAARDGAGGEDGRVLVGESYAVRAFGGSRQAVGQRLRIRNPEDGGVGAGGGAGDGAAARTVVIAGVLPRTFRLPHRGELDIAISMDSRRDVVPCEGCLPRAMRNLTVVGRLTDGTHSRDVEGRLGAVAETLARRFPDSNGHVPGVAVMPIRDVVLGGDTGRALRLLLAGCAVLLVSACFNTGNLLLARGIMRRREHAVRHALGATRGMLARAVCVESLLLALLGTMIGMGLAWVTQSFLRSRFPELLDSLRLASFDLRGVLSIGVVFLLSALASGGIPAWRVWRQDPAAGLLELGRASPHRRDTRWATALVSIQVAVTVTLAVAAIMLSRSYMRLDAVAPGFRQAGVLVATLDPNAALLAPEHVSAARVRESADALRRLPGVVEVAVTSAVPIRDAAGRATLAAAAEPGGASQPAPSTVEMINVSPSYFAVMGIALEEGRSFVADDALPGRGRVVIVNETAARWYWPTASAIGKQFAGAQTVVGVVSDVRTLSLDQRPEAAIYRPFRGGHANLVIQASGELDRVRREVDRLADRYHLTAVTPLAGVLADATQGGRLRAVLFAVLASVTLVLTLVGIVCMNAYYASGRRRELSIRAALGASPRRIVRLALTQALVSLSAGGLLAVPLAVVAGRLLERFLFETPVVEPFVIAAVLLAIGSLSLVASYAMIRRMVTVNPAQALQAG